MAILLMVIITAATLMRYIFEMDLYGYEEWVKIFAFWPLLHGSRITEPSLGRTSPPTYQLLSERRSVQENPYLREMRYHARVTLLFTKYGWDYFIFGFLGPLGTGVAIPRTVAWRIPLWTAYAAIFLGLLSMSYYFLWDTIRAGQALFGGKSK